MKRTVFLVIASAFCAILFSAAGTTGNYIEDKEGRWTEIRDVMPGKRVRCRSVVAAEGGREHTLQSDFSQGVVFLSLDALRCNGKPVNASLYTLLNGRFIQSGAFEVRLASAFCPPGESVLEIEYSVYLDETAGKDNRCGMILLEENGTAGSVTAELHTYGFQIYRAVSIPDAEKQSNPLPGACYSLYRDSELLERVAFCRAGDGTYIACAGECCSHSRHLYLMRTGENGTVQISGLSGGTYYLLENRTPEGHVSMAKGTEITLSPEGGVNAGGVLLSDGKLCLIEHTAGQKEKEKDPLAFYTYGSRVLSALLTAMVAARKKLFS